jgi:hypothetical protein
MELESDVEGLRLTLVKALGERYLVRDSNGLSEARIIP